MSGNYLDPLQAFTDFESAKLDEDDQTEDRSNNVCYLPKGKKSIFITKSGAFIKYEHLSNNIKSIKKIENYFTLRAKTLTGQFKQLKCCMLDKNKQRLIVPRFGIFEVLTSRFGLDGCYTKSQIAPGDNPSAPFVWKGKQNTNQKIISDHIMSTYYVKERVQNGSAGLILNLEAGQGKSYLAAYLISVIQKKTLIVLHSTSLIEQWVNVLVKVFGKDVKIGYYYAKKKIDGDIVLQIVDSSSNDSFIINKKTYDPINYYNRFGFAIYDECHTYSNRTALKALKSAQTPYMLGLSATPDEHPDKFDYAVWWSIGPVLTAAQLPGYESTSENFTATVHRVMFYGAPEYTKTLLNEVTDMTNNSATINMLCEDPIRSAVIIDCIDKSLKLGLYTFVFADRREYLTKLNKLLQLTHSISGEILDNDDDFRRIVGGSSPEELAKAELKSKVIFTTYPYMGTGKSIVKMNGLILATPRKSKMRQYINRIFRLGSDEKIERHIWDICDMRLKLSNQWSVRHAYYKEKNYTIVKETINYENYDGNVIEIEDIEVEDVNVEVTKDKATKVTTKDTVASNTDNTDNVVKRKPQKIDEKKIAAAVSSMLAKLLS